MSEEDRIFEAALQAELNGSGAPVEFPAVEEALSDLDRPTQALIRMRYMRGLTDRQIGSILDLEPSEVADRIANGLAKIKETLN